MPQLRKDPFLDRWVIVATERWNRPNQFDLRSDSTSGDPCPFCSGNEAMTPPEILALRPQGIAQNGPGWTVRVVPNKFPALVAAGRLNFRTAGLYELMDGLGTHEVIIETPRHEHDMSALSATQFADVVRVYQERARTLQQDRSLRSILIFKNQGAEAGATIAHAHSQLIALPFVPQQIGDELAAAERYHAHTGRCVYCDALAQEREERSRVIAESENFTVLCPFASRFPFECWILPNRHAPCFEPIPEAESVALAGALKETLLRISRALANPPFNYVIHSLASAQPGSAHYHWHIKIMQKLTQAAGFEWGSGSFINPVSPETAAESLRDFGPRRKESAA